MAVARAANGVVEAVEATDVAALDVAAVTEGVSVEVPMGLKFPHPARLVAIVACWAAERPVTV
jgi:hypothetical protein